MRALGAGAAWALAALVAFAVPAATEAGGAETLFVDEAAHPDSRSERWDLAGHLLTPEGRAFYLLAAFRRGDHPTFGEGSLLTLVVSDPAGGRALSDVNLISKPSSAPVPGPLRLEWEGSRLERLGEEGSLRLEAAGKDDATRTPLAASLSMRAQAPPSGLGGEGPRPFGPSLNIVFGSQMSRLEAQGTVTVGEESYTVSGLVWFSHLWGPFDGTGRAFDGRLTWWAHLSDGRDLKVEVFQGLKGSSASLATALWVEDGAVREERLEAEPRVLRSWSSRRGVVYPVSWRVELPGGELRCRPPLEEGEVLYELKVFWVRWTSLSWVGGCRLEGMVGGRAVDGEAVVEATGFSPPR